MTSETWHFQCTPLTFPWTKFSPSASKLWSGVAEFLRVLPSPLYSTASPPRLSITQWNCRSWENGFLQQNLAAPALSHQGSLTTASWVPCTYTRGCPSLSESKMSTRLCVSQGWIPGSGLNSFGESWAHLRSPWPLCFLFPITEMPVFQYDIQ